MSYVVFVVVRLYQYLGLLENVFFLVRFTSIRDFYTLQDARLLFMIVVRKTPYLICYTFYVTAILFSNSCCHVLVTSCSHCCVYAACSSSIKRNIHFVFIILSLYLIPMSPDL